MRGVASRFAANMDNILGFLDVVAATMQLAKESVGRNRSISSFQVAARRVHKSVLSSNRFTLVAFDGAFLTACAEYELAIRDLIEKYIQRAASKCPQYNHLPKEMRDWYPEGCARIILHIKNDRFSHLTRDSVVRSLADSSKNLSGTLVGEAFSDNERNFWPEDIDVFFQDRLGINKIWQKLSRNTSFQASIGTTIPATAEQVARMKLRDLLSKRNNIIHRGRSYYNPSESEIRECVEFYRALISSLAEIMENTIVAL